MTDNSMVHMKLFLWFYTTEANEKILNFETYTYKSEIIHNSCFKMWHTLIKPSILFSPSHVQTCGHLHMHIIPKHTYLHLTKLYNIIKIRAQLLPCIVV